MEKEIFVCNSCKKNVANDRGATSFSCPNCLKTEIIRCLNCRKRATKYTCSNCNFTGPN